MIIVPVPFQVWLEPDPVPYVNPVLIDQDDPSNGCENQHHFGVSLDHFIPFLSAGISMLRLGHPVDLFALEDK